jgi:hypothetical protein
VTTRVHAEAGMVGKLLMIWLLLLALIGVAVVDTASILITKFRLDDLAVNAANDASNALTRGETPTEACQVAADRVAADDEKAKLAKGDGCTVDTRSAEVTIALRETAWTLVAGRVSFTEDLTKVTARETVSPGAL